MDGQNGYYQNPVMNFGGNFVNNVSYVPENDDPDDHHFISSDGRIDDDNQANALALPLPLLLPLPRGPDSPSQITPVLNYYEFLTETSSILHKAPSLESIPPPVNDSDFIQRILDTQTESFYNNPRTASCSKLVDSSPDQDAWKSISHFYMFNADNHESFLNVRDSEEEQVNKLKSSQDQSQAQIHVSRIQDPSEDVGNVSGSHSKAKVSPSVFLSNPSPKATRQRASSRDRLRKERIAERLKALQELLPNSVEGSQTAVMDEVINHITSLQFQMKELTRSRLGGHLCSVPSIFIEGYHHSILPDQTMDEPLEETMGNLLKVNSSAAMKFLESKGLFVMPMTLANRLGHAI